MKTIYRYTWLNGCVTYSEGYTEEERALYESAFGKLVRQEEAI